MRGQTPTKALEDAVGGEERSGTASLAPPAEVLSARPLRLCRRTLELYSAINPAVVSRLTPDLMARLRSVLGVGVATRRRGGVELARLRFAAKSVSLVRGSGKRISTG